MDVHACFAQRGLVGEANAEKRREALSQLRWEAFRAERVFVADRDHRDREAAVLQRDEAAQQALADVLARARGEAERRRARLKELLEAIVAAIAVSTQVVPALNCMVSTAIHLVLASGATSFTRRRPRE